MQTRATSDASRAYRTAAIAIVTGCAAVVVACAVPGDPAPDLPSLRSAVPPPALPVSETPEQLTGRVYGWQRTELRGGATVAASAPERYTIEFLANGRAALRADCNRGTAAYLLPETGRLSISGAATTKIACPAGSQDTEFLRELAAVETYVFTGRELKFGLADDAGVMILTALRSP